ncbi:MAG: S8 family serine peptidase [Planctomycetota bacterium]|nr:S8 family serine peptidase [Planctomycetota bacterium]
MPKYTGISWAAKANKLSQSLRSVSDIVTSSHDPLREERYFVIALPVPEVAKESKDKRKAPQGTFKERTEFKGTHGKVFDRLQLDLLHVTDDGKAIVHAEKQRFDQILHRAETLETLGVREQSRWATIDSFDVIPLELRVDAEWLQELVENEPSDVIIELQPVLGRKDADRMLRAITDLLVRTPGERLTGTGTDFSGRHWFRGKASRRSIRKIAKDFYSVQAVHAPLCSIAAGKQQRRAATNLRGHAIPEVRPDITTLPCVAVMDMGIPADHVRLRHYRRGQFYAQDAPRGSIGEHGSRVASRVVFGDFENHSELERAAGQCAFFDAMVARAFNPDQDKVDDKLVMEALRGVRGTAPDARVFNLSFGDVRSLSDIPTVERGVKCADLRDLDNFIFANDCAVVVAAGNSRIGVPPNSPYPDHHDDQRWALGLWSSGFNTWICGAYVSQISTQGLVQSVGWPSPFTRIGPGICDAPVPSFSAPGGNWDENYQPRPGLGVWTLSAAGLPEDYAGTSHAAPILAREVALTLHALQQHCVPGTQPFAVTARSFLTLTANPPVRDPAINALAERTLGHGQAKIERLLSPTRGSAVILWQGYIESTRDTVRVQLPIPIPWLDDAEKPVLRLIVCYDPPVNDAVPGIWACRRVKPVLRLGPDSEAVRAPRGRNASFPVIDREYLLERYKPGSDKVAEGDLWVLELSYDEIAPYPPGMDFDPRQRVALAVELYDRGQSNADPQPALQSLPIASSMRRLSISPTPIRNPIIVRTRI